MNGFTGDEPVVDVYDAGGGHDLLDQTAATAGTTVTADTAAPGAPLFGGAPEPGFPAPGPVRTRAVRVYAVVGEALITLGLLIVLFVVYEAWWTNITADQQVQRNAASLLRTWSRTPVVAAPPQALPVAASFGFMYIPALGADWRALLMEGTERVQVLNTGAVGHYTGTAFPWDPVGNFAVAGHRDGHGMIFRDLNDLSPGDRVYVQTEYGWYVYRLTREAPSVPIDDVAVTEPVPVGAGVTGSGRYLTLTTCTPMYLDTSRMVWFGTFVEQTSRGQVPAGVTPQS